MNAISSSNVRLLIIYSQSFEQESPFRCDIKRNIDTMSGASMKRFLLAISMIVLVFSLLGWSQPETTVRGNSVGQARLIKVRAHGRHHRAHRARRHRHHRTGA
jgi:hypothetical protein